MNVKLFRLRSVVVKAVQVTGFNHAELAAFVGEQRYRVRPFPKRDGRTGRPLGGWAPEPDGIVAHVRHDRHGVWLPCRIGDWVEMGADGEFSPVRPHHCAARYEPLVG